MLLYYNKDMEIIYRLKKTKRCITVPCCSICLLPLKHILKKDAVEIMKKSTGDYICKECARKKEGKE